MKTVTVYEAEDRKLFRTEAACLEYEQQCKNTEDANEMRGVCTRCMETFGNCVRIGTAHIE
jgi:hypothetical protein